jgi:hypothetical protein
VEILQNFVAFSEYMNFKCKAFFVLIVKKVFENSMYWDQMWGISIFTDFRPMEDKLSCCAVVSFGLGKDFSNKNLFYVGHCDTTKNMGLFSQTISKWNF